jgi:hypothetical protein
VPAVLVLAVVAAVVARVVAAVVGAVVGTDVVVADVVVADVVVAEVVEPVVGADVDTVDGTADTVSVAAAASRKERTVGTAKPAVPRMRWTKRRLSEVNLSRNSLIPFPLCCRP